MSRLLLLSLAFIVMNNTYAQQISGIVVSQQGAPVAGATIGLLNATDSAVVHSTITNGKGNFSFKLSDSLPMQVKVTALGFETMVQRTHAAGELRIVLKTATALLNTVTVTAKKPMIEVRPDKIVVNVENTIIATGNSAFELLRKSPGVLIDNNDNISLLGNGVAVYIDGKPSPLTGKELADFLRSLQSTDIETIELIKNPSARYDAAGTGGIVNIRLKKNKSYGLNGSVASSYGIGIFAKYNNSIALNYRNKKINLFANYTNYFGNNESWINLYREQHDSIYDQQSTTIKQYRGQNLKTGVDYFLNKKNTVGVMVSVFGDTWNDRSRATTPIISIIGKNRGSILVANNESAGDKNNANANLNHHYKDSTGTEWNTDIDYGHFSNAQNAFQPNQYLAPDGKTVLEEKNYTIVTSRRIDLLTFKTDYERSWLGGHAAMGIKTSWVKTDNNFDFSNFVNGMFEPDSARSNRFGLKENIYAGYFSYSRKIKKWDLQAGVRVEHTGTRGILSAAVAQNNQDIARSYTDLFPSFALAYALNKNNGLNLSFSRRIQRPGYQDLNPFESKLDELTYQKGNPFLKPEYTNSVAITHSYLYKLNTSIGYSRTTDFSAQITDTIEGKRNFIQQRNAGTQENLYVNISYPFNIARWWNVYLTTGAGRLTNKVNLGPGLVSNIAVVSYNFYSQHTIILPLKYTIEVSGFYNSPSVWGGTFLNRSFWGVDAGIQKRMLNEKLTIKMTVSDLFNSMHWRGTSNFAGLYMDASGGWESRQLKVNAVFRFGRKEIKAQRTRTTGSDEINKRL